METPTTFSQQYNNVGSDERIQENNEINCGANFSYMLYLRDHGPKITSAPNVLINRWL